MFGPRVESIDNEEVPPFYISLRIHDQILHNTVFDCGTSRNLMPKVIMDNLGLDVTSPYKDLYSFDSRKVRCLGLINNLVVTLHQIPEKSVVMDVVVADALAKFGMLLSISWDAKLKGTLQMDMSYVTILVFSEQRRLYRENRLAYMISSRDNPKNHHIYDVDTYLGSSIFYNDFSFEGTNKKEIQIHKEEGNHQHLQIEPKFEQEKQQNEELKDNKEPWGIIHFDGVVSEKFVGVGIWISPPKNRTDCPFLYSYKPYFECTNNVAEYEALILGLNILKKLKAKKVYIYGDLKLVINQINGAYQTKHPKLRSYRNLVIDLLENVNEYLPIVLPKN